MYCCEDTGSIPALDKEKFVHINMSVDDARWIARKLDSVRQDSDNGNGELYITIVGKTIKKIRTICDEFCESLAPKKHRNR